MSDNQAIEPVIEASEVFYQQAHAELDESTDEAEGNETGEDEAVAESEVEAELVDDADDNDEAETDADESDTESEEDDESDGETLYLELDGEEFSLDEIRDWKSGAMMQADYTKKTQEVAEQRKALDADKTAFDATKTKVSELALELEAMVAEDEAIDWVELKEDDPERYIELKEKADKRKAKVAELKSTTQQPNTLSQDQLVAEHKELFSANPEWLNDKGERTEAYEKDIKLAYEYAESLGYSNEEMQGMCYAHHWKTLIDASKFKAQKGKKKSILDKKVKKAPLVTKPKKNQVKKAKSTADVFYGT